MFSLYQRNALCSKTILIVLFFQFQSIVGGLKISEMARLNKVIMEKGDHPDFCNGISYMMSLETVKTFLETIQKPEVRKNSKIFC